MESVPVVDLGDTEATNALRLACGTSGFFHLVGHGVADELVQQMWDSSRALFDLPLASKLCVAMPSPGYPYGYSPLAGERLAASIGYGGQPDLKESFAIGPVDPPTHTFVDADEAFAWSANIWPPEIAHFRQTWEAYFRALSGLAALLLQRMAVALDLPPEWFDSSINRHTSALRALNYPAVPATLVGEGQLGAGAHTDYGTLTILLADPDEMGLQVLSPDGSWHDIHPEPHGFVVNLGDAMARWTNDRWRSTMHRVVVPKARRQSIAFFHNANWDAVITCLPTCKPRGTIAKYPPIQAGPHLMSKFRSTVLD